MVKDMRTTCKLHYKTYGNLAEVKIQRCILQRDLLSLLLFIIAMILLNYIRRKCKDGNRLIKLQEKINYLMYIDDKMYINKRKLKTLITNIRIFSQDIGM